MEIHVGSQVEWRRPVQNGNLVEIGNVVRINAQQGTALVDFPQLYKMQTVPMSQLTSTLKRFGAVRVQESPSRRSLVNLMNQ